MESKKNISMDLISKLTAIVGAEFILTDEASCAFYSQDVFTKSLASVAVIKPINSKDLASVVKLSTEYGHAVIPRGGGMSYTSGYVPQENASITLDLSRMNQVLEINQEDMYVTVECGCTWLDLHKALQGTGLRTPYWGTLSGKFATVGGSLSQNSIFWGSGEYGSAADSVIGLEVVLADGSLIKTGAHSQINSTPFFRHFGPDLTGLFTSDSGAFGFKTKATLRLLPEFEVQEFLAYDFSEAKQAIAAMSEISRKNLAMECFGFDPYLQSVRMRRASMSSDVKALANVMKSSGSLLGAIKDGAKVALAGRRYMDDVKYSVQILVEDHTPVGAKYKAEKIRAICADNAGKEIENSIPKILRANPFGSVNNMLGPDGERWVPVHGLLPHSKIQEAYVAVESVFKKHAEAMRANHIDIGYLFATISTTCFVLEPVFFYQDSTEVFHAEYVETEHFAKLKGFPENVVCRNLVKQIKQELCLLFKELGAVHLQIGKAYHYAGAINPEALKLISGIKKLLDPKSRVNPKSLGLG